jgi:U3 small nucleolar RNA-associated protein 21
MAGNDKLTITCAQITADQQWAIIGFKESLVHVYNLQSKRLKSKINLCSIGGLENNNNNKNVFEVMGIALSSTESTILIGTCKGIFFYQFPGSVQTQVMDLDWPVRKVFSRPTSNLAGIILGNFEVLVCDVSTAQIVRRLKECCSPVTDATFSPDMKWVTASTSDGCILTWDVPTGNLVDIFRNFPSSITSLDYSPRGDFMVTTHANEVGIKLWVNKSVFEVSPPLVPIPTDYYPQTPTDVAPYSIGN